MKKARIEPINLSPSFLGRVLSKGYDYAVAEKLELFSKKDTSAMSEGKALHAYIAKSLGGVNSELVLCPYSDFRKKEAREWRDLQDKDAVIVMPDKVAVYEDIVQRLLQIDLIRDKYKTAKYEDVIVQKYGDLNVKGVLDFYARKSSKDEDDKTIVIDWKYVSSQSFDDFGKKATYMHYDLQAYIYRQLVGADDVYFCTIENEAPYRIKLWSTDMLFLQNGEYKFDNVLKIIQGSRWRYPSFNIPEVGTLTSYYNYQAN